MKIKLIAVLTFATALCCQCFALAVHTNKIKNSAVFGISFPSGNSLFMTAKSISSISRHSYFSGTLQVTELTIDTLGGVSQMRIYHVTPIDPLALAQDAGTNLPGRMSNITSAAERLESAKDALTKKTGVQTPSTDKVYKQYPNTTHAHTVEYAVDSLEELDNLYQALIKDFAGSDTQSNDESAQSSKNQKSSGKESLGGKLYEVQSAKELSEGKE